MVLWFFLGLIKNFGFDPTLTHHHNNSCHPS